MLHRVAGYVKGQCSAGSGDICESVGIDGAALGGATGARSRGTIVFEQLLCMFELLWLSRYKRFCLLVKIK